MWNTTDNQINLLLIRHGATEANMEHRYLGRTDVSLSVEGVRELKKRADTYPTVDCLFASPMKRCLQTAKVLYPSQRPMIIQAWREMDFGLFEGKNYKELQNDLQYQAWIDSYGSLPFPQGESREEFALRCKTGFYEMLQQLGKICDTNGKQEMNIGLIVHGGTIMALLSDFYGGEYYDYQVSNGGAYRCKMTCGEECVRLYDLEEIHP